MVFSKPLLLTALLLSVQLCSGLLPIYACQPSDIPDFTKGDSIPDGAIHDWNLGPTGARGWIYSHRMETTQARQILVTSVQNQTPASAVLQPGDVLLGVAGNAFSEDPRRELGMAISQAEGRDGRLEILRWRDGSQEWVFVQLPILGHYSNTAPFDCDKSRQIFFYGCEVLAERMEANPQAGNRIVRAWNTLALLASGRKDYLPIIKQQVADAATFSDVEGRSLCCWFYGPVNLLLAEYTLATGDETYLPDMKRITMEIVDGQSAVGSWGHRFARPDGRLNGYGMMNAPGLPLTLSLVLAREAGVSHPQLDDAIEKSTRLMRFYVGKGCIPYGDHAPWMETHDDNGKNGIGAVLFNALQDQEAAEYFSRMSVASHGAEREMGHTGNYFNMLWAMPGVAISGPEASGAWMREFGWYYDLARQADGTYLHQGPAQANKDSYYQWDATGAYLLAYAQPLRQLAITGRRSDVVPQLTREQADNLVKDGSGYSHRLKDQIYADHSIDQLFHALQSWSPVVRQRAGSALARREEDCVARLVALLDHPTTETRLGACEALAALKDRAATAVPQLRKTLNDPEMWVRVKAAEALAAIGPPARVAIPDILHLLSNSEASDDPRRMQQRFLTFAMFNKRNGLLRGSIDGVNLEALYLAVKSGLQNEDGRARSEIGNVYRSLSFEEIEPLLPTIYEAVVVPAPSGIMFADGVRLAGLEILTQHRIREAIPLCMSVMEADRWGAGNRIPRCLSCLQKFGGAASATLPELQQLLNQLESKKLKTPKDEQQINLLRATIETIRNDQTEGELRSLSTI